MPPTIFSDVLRARALKSQVAVVRTLADEIERLAPPGGGDDTLREQLANELTRLGCLALEAAADLTRTAPSASASDDSGVRAIAAIVGAAR